MRTVKIRRVGNSNVISLPRELEGSGYTDGATVLIDQLPSGELQILRADDVRARIRALGQRVLREDREALDILKSHDSG
ncbi:MAG: hypothetical protein ACR2JC_16280 [Chloroflexota bacterium]